MFRLIMKRLKQKLICWAKCHYNALNANFDPIVHHHYNHKNGQNSPNSIRFNRAHFLLPILVILYIQLYGLFYLPYEAAGKWFDWVNLAQSPYLYIHQCIPQILWPQYDFSAAVAIVSVLATLSTFLLVTKPIDEQFIINHWIGKRGEQKFSIGSRIKFRKSESIQLEKQVQVVQRWIKPSIALVLLVFNAFYYCNVYHNGRFRVNFGSILFWLGGNVAFIIYMTYGK